MHNGRLMRMVSVQSALGRAGDSESQVLTELWNNYYYGLPKTRMLTGNTNFT